MEKSAFIIVIIIAGGVIPSMNCSSSEVGSMVTLEDGRVVRDIGPLETPLFPNDPAYRAKVRLGQKLFFERDWGGKNYTCASCHSPEDGFANKSQMHSERGRRNAPTLYNSAFNAFYHWDGSFTSLEDQVIKPLCSPDEMNAKCKADVKTGKIPVVEQLKSLTDQNKNPVYWPLFVDAGYPDVTMEGIQESIAEFERTLISNNSGFDLYIQSGRQYNKYFGPRAEAGIEVFRKYKCISCHYGPNFTDNYGPKLRLHTLKSVPDDNGGYRTPTLRHVAGTRPYMHDGSEFNFEDILNFFQNKYGFGKTERDELGAFLSSLTGNECRFFNEKNFFEPDYEGSENLRRRC